MRMLTLIAAAILATNLAPPVFAQAANGEEVADPTADTAPSPAMNIVPLGAPMTVRDVARDAVDATPFPLGAAVFFTVDVEVSGNAQAVGAIVTLDPDGEYEYDCPDGRCVG